MPIKGCLEGVQNRMERKVNGSHTMKTFLHPLKQFLHSGKYAEIPGYVFGGKDKARMKEK